VVVTGTLGAASLGLRLLRKGARLDDEGNLSALGVWTESSAPAVRHCLRAQLDPAPPLAFARALSERELARAGMDISDGLSGDLLALCTESGVSARLDPSCLPVDPQAAGLERARGGDPISLALHGGEDYQLLLAIPPGQLEALHDLAVVWDVTVAVVGVFGAGEPVVLLEGGARLEPASHEHFRSRRRSGEPALEA
jgi:thiamine-monophosphate kinase